MTMMFSQPGNVLGIFGVTLLLSHLLLGYYLVAAVHDYFLRRRLFSELVEGVARLRYIGQLENEVVYSLTDTRGSRYELRCHSNPAESAAPK
ncbi:hypothetical protein [Lacticaseibacillus hulanensis]|uniref:hypothetical protein n=1 Tax=Lacticaseibacillus hulanensis TaxID=2493111 RepID=UPI000FD884FB|nr:hypothetical protein [Lacticaseibacillus hulanensis]